MVPPDKAVMTMKDYKQLTGANMLSCLDAEGIAPAMDWIKEAARHGEMPVNELAGGADDDEE